LIKAPDAQPILIEAQKLTRVYAAGQVLVTGIDHVDLSISAGELVVLKGESGSGKSTLLSLLAGLDRPSSGRLTVAGYDLNHTGEDRLTQYRRSVVGIVFQSFNLLPTLSVYENICLPAMLAGQPAGKVRVKAGKLIDWLVLGKRRDHLPSQLSGGEMQRTAIARALINNPALVLADEPTGNLDSRKSHLVIDLLRDLNRTFGCSVIIATHSLLADAFASKHLLLKDGKLIQD
jgi:ABC-type lipoprotein export system ATPase subunit